KSTRQSTISNAPAGRSSRKYAGKAPHMAKAATAKKMPERSRADAAAGLGVAEGILKTLLRSFGPEEPRRPARFPGRAFGEELLANDHGEHVASRENEKVLSAVLDLGSAVLGVDDLVANRDVERNAVAIVVDAAWGFSFAVSGMTSPEAVVCSASTCLMTMRSSSGLMETATLTSSFSKLRKLGLALSLRVCQNHCTGRLALSQS